ncbi:hypothetical protein ACVWXM_000130 [Bradyrhizobium sp. GM7.3]
MYIPTPPYPAVMLIIHDQFKTAVWLGEHDMPHLVAT